MQRLVPIALLAASAAGQTGDLNAQLAQTVLYRDPAISPDGKLVAWGQTTLGEDRPRMHVRAADSAAEAQLVRGSAAGGRRDSDPAFSPDSKSLAFLSKAGEGKPPQLWTLAVPGTAAKKRADLPGYAARPRWSPDGKQIALLFVEGGEGGGPLHAAPAQTGVIEAHVRNQRIAVLDLATGKLRQASPPDLHVYDFDWSPDGTSFVMTAAPGPGDNNWWIAKLYTVDAAAQAKVIYEPKWQIGVPRWSPDGRAIAFIEGLMSDEGFHGGDLMTIDPDGSGVINRTRGRRTSVSSLFWTGPGKLVATEWVNGGTALTEFSLGSGTLRELWRGDERLHGYGNFPTFALTPDGASSIAVRNDFMTPPEVWTGAPGSWQRLTSGNSAQTPRWGKGETLEWQSDGFRVQGWMLPPAQVEPGKRYPMVVLVHGGPTGMEAPRWPNGSSVSAALASKGYYVLMPNPRGSYGQGEEFTQANIKDFGGGDLRDILKGVDAALARYPIDPDRLGITGWSYGGYMTMWTVTQTRRFRAAMAGAGISNLQSYYGQNRIDRWLIPFFGASVYDDPAVYAKSSPINFIKAVKTPVLVLVGERDAECPAPQSFEFWHALRTFGVPTELVVYAAEGHLFSDPKNRVDMLDRTIAWFDKYLRASEEGGPPIRP